MSRLCSNSVENSQVMETYSVEIWMFRAIINLEISFLLRYHKLVDCNFSYTARSTAEVKLSVFSQCLEYRTSY
jgi:hypothetical protein